MVHGPKETISHPRLASGVCEPLEEISFVLSSVFCSQEANMAFYSVFKNAFWGNLYGIVLTPSFYQ
jgi:hypothetical protein